MAQIIGAWKQLPGKAAREFQIALGWTNSHLHSFTIADLRYSMHYDDYPEDEIDEKCDRDFRPKRID